MATHARPVGASCPAAARRGGQQVRAGREDLTEHNGLVRRLLKDITRSATAPFRWPGTGPRDDRHHQTPRNEHWHLDMLVIPPDTAADTAAAALSGVTRGHSVAALHAILTRGDHIPGPRLTLAPRSNRIRTVELRARAVWWPERLAADGRRRTAGPRHRHPTPRRPDHLLDHLRGGHAERCWLRLARAQAACPALRTSAQSIQVTSDMEERRCGRSALEIHPGARVRRGCLVVDHLAIHPRKGPSTSGGHRRFPR